MDGWKFILALWKVSVWIHSQTDNFLYCQDTKFYQRILFQNSCIFELINDHTPGDLWQFKVLWKPLYACYRLKSHMMYFQRAAFSAFRYAPKVEWMEIDLDLLRCHNVRIVSEAYNFLFCQNNTISSPSVDSKFLAFLLN